MAEAILHVVLENLDFLIQNEIGLLWGIDKELEKLSSTISTIQAVLEDAEEKQVRDKAIKNWLRKLKDAAHKVDDILDECSTEASRLTFKVNPSCFCPNNILFRRKIGKNIVKFRERLDEIAQERMKFHLIEVVNRRVELVSEKRQTGSIVTQAHVYGRDEDKEKVIDYLVDCVPNFDDVTVYPIVGIGGLGKTTLAQLVFNDERMKKHFELRIWVCVSEDFDARRLVKAIIESASGNACPELDLDPMQRRLREILTGKRYLLVLDDVWNEDQEKWDRLKYVLACGSKGASIIVTTRLKKVASVMGTLPIHNLSCLSEDDCWSLFRECAFGHGKEASSRIIDIENEIVRKCGGVPLAAKTLGSLMCYKSGENEWLSVKESEIWNLPQDESSILPALRLSYSNLPLNLRKCFAYCAIFPKDIVMEKEDLIHLWMANGFISSVRNMELEDIGNEICNELYWRSFFQDVEKDKLGRIKRFKMHDLIHDLAQSVMEDECCVEEAERFVVNSRRIQHVTLLTYWIVLSHSFREPIENIGCPKLKVLPETLCYIPALQSLSISCYPELVSLPDWLGDITSLQSLQIFNCPNLKSFPLNIRRLTNLQNLDIQQCPALSKQCEKETGEDWHKIVHVPNVNIYPLPATK